MKLIALDVCSNRVVGARFNDDMLLEKISMPITMESQTAVFDIMFAIVNKLAEKDVKGICVACSGIVDPFEGICVKSADDTKFLSAMYFKDVLEEKYDVPCVVISTAQAHLLNSMYYGVGKGYRSASLIEISRTISGAYYNTGTIIVGKNFDYGNLAHRTIDVKGLPCSCGSNGCMEQYITTTAFENNARNMGMDITDFIQVFDKYILEDAQAKSVVMSFVMRLAQCVNFIKKNFKPEIVIISGDFNGSQNIWLPILKETKIARRNVVCSRISSDGALYGSIVWFMQRNKI